MLHAEKPALCQKISPRHLNHGIVGILMPTFRSYSIEDPTYLTVVRVFACFSVLLAFGLCPTTTRAQYQFDHWTADNGLPQNSVRDIVQTRDGYLWLATLDGLVRFDGVRFTVFNKSNSPGIISNRFLQLYEDGQGDLWALTENSGATRLHRDRFTTYTSADVPDVNIIGGDGQGHPLMSSGSHWIRWFENKFQPADELRLTDGALPSDKAQHLPASIPHTSCFVDGQFRTWQKTDLPLRLQPPAQDHNGVLWFESSAGLLHWENGRIVKGNQQPDGLLAAETRFIHGQSTSLQAFSRKQDGSLWLLDVDSMQSQLVAQKPPEGLNQFVAYADREGSYWFGTRLNGLYRARRQAVTSYTKAQGLTAGKIYPILEDHTGAIWIGSIGNGVFRYQNGVFTQLHTVTLPYQSNDSSLFEDRTGRVWVSGHRCSLTDVWHRRPRRNF